VLVGAAQLSALLARTESLARRADGPAAGSPADRFPASVADIERLYLLVADEVRASIALFPRA